ncbi:hypothetical protein DFP72DRAFT_882307 [Ephemerocybe angulata]|uniref:Uncharacterized protein n=1 Tax=Ephemerocybe angulata TaxID=980116 RepID=A0A8H6I7T0_9AGAR|nr:hypothetical protein DFP72DRAFT_882307 [Tulosesus angulatus]
MVQVTSVRGGGMTRMRIPLPFVLFLFLASFLVMRSCRSHSRTGLSQSLPSSSLQQVSLYALGEPLEIRDRSSRSCCV